ncbi:hypothetical protein Tco_0518160 [Tanacetum coccineum]
MDDPNITMEEYIRLEEEKARKRGKVFNWETTKYGKIWHDEDVHDLRSVETEFPAIVFNDNLTSNETLSCEPTVSSLNNNKIDFRISFDESDDEDYTVVFDKNSFFYKIISANDWKTDSENDNEKVNMPLFPSPEPSVSCIDDLVFFKDFENEFSAIVYNDPLTSKLDFSTEPTLCPQHIHKFNFKDETSLSEYDEVEQNVVGYTKEIVHDFEKRLETIFERQVNRVHTLDFEGLTLDMRQDLAEILRMVYTGDDGQEVFVSHAWKRLFEIRAPLVQEFTLEFLSTCRIGSEMGLDVADTLCFQLGGARCSMTWRQFILALGLHTAEEMVEDGSEDPMQKLCHRLISCTIAGRSQAPEKVTMTDLFYLRGMDVGSVKVPYLLARYLRLFASGRKQGAMISGGQFVARLAEHFGLLTEERLQGLTMIVRELPVIDTTELVRLQICEEIDDTWAWVAPGPERLQVVAAGAPEAAKDAPVIDEGTQDDPIPVQAPQPPPPARTMPKRMARLEEDMHEIRVALGEQREVMDAMARDFSRFTV